MSLNNIELPAAVVADLYKTSLVSERAGGAILPNPEPALNDSPAKQTDNKYLGSNRQSILIVVKHSDVVYIPDEELQFLTGILKACNRSMEDVAVVNLNNHPGSSYKELTGSLKSKIVLLFAIEPSSFGLPVSFPHYQLQAFAGCTYLFTPSLKHLENDKLEKSKLWVCLKRLFNL